MPLYLYQNPETQEIKEVFQGMKDEHSYQENGVVWKRIFTKPNASIDSIANIDPFNKQKFIQKTGSLKGTVGDMMDLSKEMSHQRSDKVGTEDPVKRKFFNDYEKNIGKKHLEDKPKKIERKGVTVELD